MATAERILKKKQYIKSEMDKSISNSDELWSRAACRLTEILNAYSHFSKEERLHPEGYIFPSAAIYHTLKEEVGQEEAYGIIERAAIKLTLDTGNKLKKALKIPGFRSFFVWVWEPMTKKMFGPSHDFQNVFYPKVKGEYRMDITACPYNRYFTELGCPELTKIFCDNDERCYGDLPGLKFIRTSTLGKGGDRCDFYLKKE